MRCRAMASANAFSSTYGPRSQPVRYLSRKSGSSAFEPKSRAPSKQQLKRKREALVLKKERVDQRKEKLKAAAIQRKINSPAMDEMYDKLNAEAGDAIREFMLPDSASAALNELGMSEEEMLEKAAYDCVDLLESLRKRKKEREAGVLPLTGKSGNTSASSASASALINSRQDDDEDDALLDADSISEDEYMGRAKA